MKTKLLFLTVLLFVLGIQAQIPQTERDALIGLYNATNGSGWTKKTNWDTNPASTSNVSTWYGITTQTIGGQEYVTEIDLHNNQLNGTLSNLTAFTKLKKLILYKNSISGTQPNMSGFTEFTHLNIAGNQFSGTVNATHFPTTITVIDLSKNQFTENANLTGCAGTLTT